jgi:hypothetical protein
MQIVTVWSESKGKFEEFSTKYDVFYDETLRQCGNRSKGTIERYTPTNSIEAAKRKRQ